MGMSAEEAIAYIHSNTWTRHAPGLARIRALCHALGDPQSKLRFIHVAGTNGKGSTCAMLDAILRAAGYRVGLFTSPYILRFNERIQVDGVPVPDDELAEITESVRPFADAMEDTPTEFELITAIGLICFARHGCDFVVFEVGMGGRLDSTNLIEAPQVAVSVITGIAMDHTAYLGDTPEKIAAEKAGIIKPGIPVVFGGHHAPVGRTSGHDAVPVDPASCASVIQQAARRVSAPYVQVDDSLLRNVRSDLMGSDFDFGRWVGLHLPLAGLYQPYNAATVLTVVDVLRQQGISIPEKAIRNGLASVRWPGRFELLCRDPVVISDGGHNPEGIDAAVASALACFGGKRVNLLTGVMADKDYTHMVRRMGDLAARVFAVRPDDGHGRSLDAGRYAALFESMGIRADGYPTVAAALADALPACREDNRPLLCIGSLYMYRELREALAEFAESK